MNNLNFIKELIIELFNLVIMLISLYIFITFIYILLYKIIYIYYYNYIYNLRRCNYDINNDIYLCMEINNNL